MATVNLYERIAPETIRQLQEQVARFNENRNARNGYYAISIATPYRKYYGLWRVFPEGHPPVFLRTLSNQFTEAVQKAIDLLEYSKVALTWLDNSFFMPYYGSTYDILSFGKYHGKHLAEVYYVDPNYVLWLANKFDPEKKQLKQLVELAKDFALIHSELTPPRKRVYSSSSRFVAKVGEKLEHLSVKIVTARLQVNTFKPDFYIDQFVTAIDQANCRYSFVVKATHRSQTPKALSCYSLKMTPGKTVTILSCKVLEHYESHGIQYTRLGYLKFDPKEF